MSKILITGASGLVGAAVVAELLAETTCELVVIARGRGNRSALDRVLHAVHEQWEFDGRDQAFITVSNRIRVVEGDVADFVPDAAARQELAEVGILFHCAADVNLGKDPYGHTYLNNTNATRQMLALARSLPQLASFQLVSTAYVAGHQRGLVLEDRLYDAPVNNAYEKSKRHCETMVRESGLPFTIYRPSIVVGRLSDGTIRKPIGFYLIPEFFGKMKKHLCAKRGLPPDAALTMPFRLQASPSDQIYFVPIDYVQKTIATLLLRPSVGKTYHVTGQAPVSVQDIAVVTNALLQVSGIEVMAEVPNPTRDEKLVQRLLSDLLPYFSSEARFDVSNVVAELGAESLAWPFGAAGLNSIIGGYFRSAFPAFKIAPLRPVGR